VTTGHPSGVTTSHLAAGELPRSTMAVTSREYGAGPERPRVSGWAVGGIAFAGAIMILVGSSR
jgi:hypothetical protein